MGLLILMTRPDLEDLPEVTLPEGYRIVSAAEFDDPAPMWAEVINRSFEDRSWTAEHVHENFISREQYDPAGVFLVMHGEEAVATAFAWPDTPQERESGRIHWVGALEQHRGKGLARAAVTAVMQYLRRHGFQRTHLETQPYRLPAIRLYLSLGLEPTPRNEEEQAAWDEVMAKLSGHTRGQA